MTDSAAISNPSPTHCFIYRGSRKNEAYLYVTHAEVFSKVPQALLDQLGELTLVMELSLTPERKLARANPVVVREALTSQGYFFQPPPTIIPLMANDRL